jgi:hypothetical protein
MLRISGARELLEACSGLSSKDNAFPSRRLRPTDTSDQVQVNHVCQRIKVIQYLASQQHQALQLRDLFATSLCGRFKKKSNNFSRTDSRWNLSAITSCRRIRSGWAHHSRFPGSLSSLLPFIPSTSRTHGRQQSCSFRSGLSMGCMRS